MFPLHTTVRRLCAILAVAACISPALAAPVSSAITYQGELQSGGVPVNGTVDIRVTLFDAATDGSSFGPPLVRSGVSVVGGRFTLSDLDFGSSAYNEARWLQIEVRSPSDPGNTAAFTTLSPRQPITPAPNAMLALSANTLGGLSSSFYTNAANLNNGVLESARLSGTYSSPLTLNNAANIFAGSGAGLTGLNASNLATGTVADARLSSNIFRLDATSTTITGGQLVLNAPGSSFSGPAGFSEVVFAARTTNPGQHTAITIDGKAGQDAILYLAENGVPVWSLRSDSSEGKDLQIRRQNAGDNAVVLSMDLSGALGINAAPSNAARVTVGGAIATTGGVIFPDGSVLRSAFGEAARPQVSYPLASTIEVFWNGDRCQLESSIALGVEVVETMIGGSSARRVLPGDLFISEVRISRVRTSGTSTWQTAANAVTPANFSAAGRSLVVSRTQASPAGTATFTLPNMAPIAYNVYVDAAGATRETLYLVSTTGAPAMPVFSGAAISTGGFAAPSGFALTVTGFPIPSTGLDVGTPTRIADTSIQFPGGQRQPVRQLVSLPVFRFVVRAPFGGSQQLRNWANDVIVTGLTTKRAMQISVGGTPAFSTLGLGGLPVTYKIIRGPDGEIYEEYEFAADSG